MKDGTGKVMTPGTPHKFASYVAYPYFLAPGSYSFTLQPGEARAAEGYQATAPVSKTLSASKSYATWSTKLRQAILTSFTVPKGASVTVTTAPERPYTSGTAVSGTADTTGETDVYTFDLTNGTKYVYRASGTGLVTSAGVFTAATAKKTMDLTADMAGSPGAITRSGTIDTADIRLSGVDYTGSLALTVGGSARLTPLRMWQIANDTIVTSRHGYALEPDFHYSVVNVDGSNVVSVDDSGKITATGTGTAIVLVTYDALHVGSLEWGVNSGETFSAIWPENTGVVVVEVGDNASAGPAVNALLGSGTKKLAGQNLDAEADVLYYTDGEYCEFTFTPAQGSTVTLLRPTLTGSAMTYSGSFSTAGVSAAESGEVKLVLTEGKNIIKVSKDGADSYQVITVKKAAAIITNETNPGEAILPGNTVKIQLTGVYSPANYMAYLSNLNTRISYLDPGSESTVTGATPITRYTFDAAEGDACRSVTVTIPTDWDPAEPYTLTAGTLLLSGNAKDIGSHRGTLSSVNSAVPYVSPSSGFTLGRLPDITVPVTAPEVGDIAVSVKDDLGADVTGWTATFKAANGDVRTLNAADGAAVTLPYGTWSYTVSKDSYLSAAGTIDVQGAAQTLDCTLTLVTGIQIKTPPAKTSYFVGETMSTTGLVVEGVTRSGVVELSKELYTVTPEVLDTKGEQTVTVTYAGHTAAFSVTVAKESISLETTLTDGIIQKNSRKTFDVFAKDGYGNKIAASEVTVELNGKAVSSTWDDAVKTSYTLKFTQEGENIITVTVRGVTLTYHITYVKAEEGEVVGQAVYTVEAFTLGGGYIIEPCYVDIREGENAAQALVRLLGERSFTYDNTGSVENGFYLSHLHSAELAGIDPTGGSIPDALKEALAKKNITVGARTDPDSLGEFDYTSYSGWMYCHKNVFPNVGFADCYLSDGDVVRVQFTVGGYGADIGGGYAMGGVTTDYYAVANKDALTSRIAEINAAIDKNGAYLKENGLTEAYQNAMDVLTNLVSSQAEVDAALARLVPVTPESAYTVGVGTGSSVAMGETANVTISVAHDSESTYNAYHFTVAYDSDKLTYTGVNTDAAVRDENGVLTISGYGADKICGTDNIVLSFTAKAIGEAVVTVTAANIDRADNANAQDAPAATVENASAAITIGGYTVTLPEDFTGESTVAPGADYTFTAKDKNYDFTFTGSTMGGADVEVVDNGDGTYTVKNVTGNIVITASKTAKQFAVTVEGSGKADVTAADQAAYGTDYTFSVAKDNAYDYTVSAKVGGADAALTNNGDGTYTIAGASITGAVTITVTKDAKPVTTTSISFEGTGSADVKGGTTQTATNGQDFQFELNAEAGFDYTVKLGGEELTAVDGKYTIPAAKLTGEALTVTVEKTAQQTLEINVSEYVKLDGTTMWLVTASGTVSDGKILAYDGTPMFWSEKYNAYAYLVISDKPLADVKAEAETKVAEAAADKTDVTYDFDVNETTMVDVNDAQLVYNMYNAKYASFDEVAMVRFLKADCNGDKVLNVLDANAVIAEIMK